MSIIIPQLNELRIVRIPDETAARKYRYAVSAVHPLVDADTNAVIMVTDTTLPAITERQAKELDNLFKNSLRACRKARNAETQKGKEKQK